MLINLNSEYKLLGRLRKEVKEDGLNLKIEIVEHIKYGTLFRFSNGFKEIYCRYSSIKHYKDYDIIAHAIYMLKRKGNEKMFNGIKRSPLVRGEIYD